MNNTAPTSSTWGNPLKSGLSGLSVTVDGWDEVLRIEKSSISNYNLISHKTSLAQPVNVVSRNGNNIVFDFVRVASVDERALGKTSVSMYQKNGIIGPPMTIAMIKSANKLKKSGIKITYGKVDPEVDSTEVNRQTKAFSVFLERVEELTTDPADRLFLNTIEEFGEFAAALNVKGGKKKSIDESAKQEAVDLVICSLTLVFANKGFDNSFLLDAQSYLDSQFSIEMDPTIESLLKSCKDNVHKKDVLLDQMAIALGHYATYKNFYSAIECFVSSLILYFSEDGTDNELVEYGMLKLDKYERSVESGN